MVASEDEYGMIKIWKMDDFSCKSTFAGHHYVSISCLISISNNRLLTACYASVIKVWNMNDYSLITENEAHNDAILSLILLKDNRLVSVSENEYKIWDMNNYNCIKTINFESK